MFNNNITMMKSDLIFVQFVDKLGCFKCDKIQEYLDGNNNWNQPINEKDIVTIKYGFDNALTESRKVLTNSILLVHRVPDNIDKGIS